MMTGTDTIATRPRQTGPRDLFLRNMAALWRTDPSLAQQLDDLPDSLLDNLVPTRTDAPTVAATSPEGRQVWLHSRYDPRKQAEQFVPELGADKGCVVLMGLALGYAAETITERIKGRSMLFVIEHDIEMIFRALHCVDLVEPLRDQRLVLLVRDDADYLPNRLEPHQLLLISGVQIVTYDPAVRLAPDFYRDMSQGITDYVAYADMSLKTALGNAQITMQNVAFNLPTYLSTPPIDMLKGLFAGCPGILLAAGPSLRKHLGMLGDLSGRAVLCCVQTLFKTLLARNVVPDFVTSLDYSEISKRFFEGVDDFRGVHLVAEPKANNATIDAYGGPISLLDNAYARLCVGDDLAGRQGLRAGATVAHLSFYLLEYLGCDPIILVGQDLAFSDGLYYAPGVATHQNWDAELNRYNSLEMMEWLRVVRNRKILKPGIDVHGNAVYTDDTMLTYLQQFERDFAGCRATVIDATEGGLPKRSTIRMPFAEAVEKHCNKPLPAEVLSYRSRTRWGDDSRLAEGRRRIEDRLERLDAFVRMCRQTGKDLEELEQLLDRNRTAEFNRRIARADRARVLARKDDLILRMVSDLAQLAEFRRTTADRLLKGLELEPVERARRQLQRDRAYNEGMIAAAEELRNILQEACKRFDEAIAGRAAGGSA